MRTIGSDTLWSFDAKGVLKKRKNVDVRAEPACRVVDYTDLATKVATLQYKNPDYVLLFRGQDDHYVRKLKSGATRTTLMPSLLRSQRGSAPSTAVLQQRFAELKAAEQALVRAYEEDDQDDVERLKRQRILRWSILQHYEICKTPLLDVTHNLRIAASFGSDHNDDNAYVFVLGVPNLSGAITASAEAGLQIVRLSSVCPPEALRPHIQEGYLLGEYPEMAGYDDKANYEHWEIDFGRRLLAKFRLSTGHFWAKSGFFPKVDHRALYPDHNDPLFKLAKTVKADLARE